MRWQSVSFTPICTQILPANLALLIGAPCDYRFPFLCVMSSSSQKSQQVLQGLMTVQEPQQVLHSHYITGPVTLPLPHTASRFVFYMELIQNIAGNSLQLL